MGLRMLRSVLRPLARTIRSHPSASPTPFCAAFTSPKPRFHLLSGGSVGPGAPWFQFANHFNSLTDTRYPKRRPSDKPRRKRASLRPRGPFAWVQYTPGEPIVPKQPNKGSVKRRGEKKRMKMRRAIKLYEKKRHMAKLQAAAEKKQIKMVERKMAAVARERAWAERLVELQKLEAEKKKSME